MGQGRGWQGGNVLIERGECNERIRINPSISETLYCVNYFIQNR